MSNIKAPKADRIGDYFHEGPTRIPFERSTRA
jgi:hypothetical protein